MFTAALLTTAKTWKQPKRPSTDERIKMWYAYTVAYCCCRCCQVASVMSDSVWPHGLQPTRLLCPWNSPGKNTGVGCHFLLHSGILLRHKKGWNNAICSYMVGPRDYHSKWSKSDRERQMPYDITYMWNLKYEMNELTYKTETDSQT